MINRNFSSKISSNPNKTKLIILAIFVGMSLFFFLFSISSVQYIKDQEILKLKKEFNENMKKKSFTEEYLKYKKILINNYFSIQDKELFQSDNIEEIKKKLSNVKFIEEERFYKLSGTAILVFFGPILFPLIIQIVKLFR